MDIRKKVARYSLLSTIMQGVMLLFAVGLLIVLVVLMGYLTGFIGDSIGLTENVNPDDVTAGWQVLFGSVGGLFGVFAGIVLIAAIILLIGPIIADTVVLIYGIRTYRKRYTAEFKRMVKNDSIIKLVINAVGVLLLILSGLSTGSSEQTIAELLEELASVLVFILPSIACVVVSIMTLQKINDIEELPEESERQYIEYNEDNSPYFGQ